MRPRSGPTGRDDHTRSDSYDYSRGDHYPERDPPGYSPPTSEYQRDPVRGIHKVDSSQNALHAHGTQNINQYNAHNGKTIFQNEQPRPQDQDYGRDRDNHYDGYDNNEHGHPRPQDQNQNYGRRRDSHYGGYDSN